MNTWPLQYYGLNTTLILWQTAFLIWLFCDAAKQNYFSRDALKMVRRYLIVFLNEGMSTITQKKNNSRNSHRCQGDPSAFSPCHLDVQPCLLEDTTAQNLPSDHNCLQLNCDKIKSKTSTTVNNLQQLQRTTIIFIVVEMTRVLFFASFPYKSTDFV